MQNNYYEPLLRLTIWMAICLWKPWFEPLNFIIGIPFCLSPLFIKQPKWLPWFLTLTLSLAFSLQGQVWIILSMSPWVLFLFAETVKHRNLTDALILLLFWIAATIWLIAALLNIPLIGFERPWTYFAAVHLFFAGGILLSIVWSRKRALEITLGFLSYLTVLIGIAIHDMAVQQIGVITYIFLWAAMLTNPQKPKIIYFFSFTCFGIGLLFSIGFAFTLNWGSLHNMLNYHAFFQVFGFLTPLVYIHKKVP